MGEGREDHLVGLVTAPASFEWPSDVIGALPPWREYRLYGGHLALQALASLDTANLTALSLVRAGVDDTVMDLLGVLFAQGALEKLDATGNAIGDDGVVTLMGHMGQVPRSKKALGLVLDENLIGDRGMSVLLGAMENRRGSVTDLSLLGNDAMTDASLEQLRQFFPHEHSFTGTPVSIRIGSSRWSVQAVDETVALKYGNVDLRLGSVAPSAAVLETIPDENIFSVIDCAVTREGMSALMHTDRTLSLGNRTEIGNVLPDWLEEDYDIFNERYSDTLEFTRIFEHSSAMLATARALERRLSFDLCLSSLSLDSCGIDAEGIDALCRGLEANLSVSELSLDLNPIGDEGAKHIGRMLTRNFVLYSISLVACSLTPTGVEAILDGLSSHHVLVSLDLDRFFFGASVVDAERAHFPAWSLDGVERNVVTAEQEVRLLALLNRNDTRPDLPGDGYLVIRALMETKMPGSLIATYVAEAVFNADDDHSFQFLAEGVCAAHAHVSKSGYSSPAFDLLHHVAQTRTTLGDSSGFCSVGVQMYLRAIQHTSDSRQRELLAAAAAEDCVPAGVAAGNMFELGRGGPVDLAAAFRCYRAAADLPGNVSAAAENTARCLRLGIGTEVDEAGAVSYLQRAREAGSRAATVDLGIMHELGRGGLHANVETAAQLYRESNSAEGRANLARLGMQ